MILKVKVFQVYIATVVYLAFAGGVLVPKCLAQGSIPPATNTQTSEAASTVTNVSATGAQRSVLQDQIEISHTPLTPDTLPFPGQPVSISVLLSSTGDFRKRLRGFAVIDGRILEISPTRSYLNDYDQPTYDFSLISPLAEISYHFVLEMGDGRFVTSTRYTIRRSCIPKIEPTDLVDASTLQPRDQFGILLEQSTLLNFDLQSYEQAIKLTEELIERLEKR